MFSALLAATAAATFLASPAVAAIANWDITFETTATDFSTAVDDEITLTYLIGTGREYRVDLFALGCEDTITGIAITHEDTRQAADSADHDRLQVQIDMDKTDITASNIWTSPFLQFCARVQLLSGEEVIKEDLQDIEIEMTLSTGFESGVSASVAQAQDAETTVANVDSYISACQCDSVESFTCLSPPVAIGPDSILKVCIMSEDTDVEIEGLVTLGLTQDNGGGDDDQTMSVVEDYGVANEAISLMTTKSATEWIVETVVPSRFFASAATVTAAGTVDVQFVGQARRLAINGDEGRRPVKKNAAPARDMRGISRPGFHGDRASTPVDPPAQVFPEAEDATRTSDFEVAIGLLSPSSASFRHGPTIFGLLGTALYFF